MIIVRSSNWKEPKIHVRPRTHSWATAVMVNVLQMATETGKTAVQAEDKLRRPFLYRMRRERSTEEPPVASAAAHFIFCSLSKSGFKLVNFCANFHTVTRKKKTLICKTKRSFS